MIKVSKTVAGRSRARQTDRVVAYLRVVGRVGKATTRFGEGVRQDGAARLRRRAGVERGPQGEEHRWRCHASCYSAGGWLVGDFGLIDMPALDELTQSGRPIGPSNFMAYEMITDPVGADSKPADVYSLGKTLWSLSTEIPTRRVRGSLEVASGRPGDRVSG